MSTASAVPTAAKRAAHHIPVSIRVLRKLRPVVVGILRSPLHAVMSREVLLLTYTGRKSGARYTFPLSFVEKNSKLYLCTRPEGSKWWLNLRGGRDVDLRLRGRVVRATATVLERDSDEAFEGLRAFVTQNPTTGEMVYHIRRGPNEEDLRREVTASVVVRIEVN